MTTTDPTRETTALDMDAVMAFVLRAVDELGASLNTSLVVMGDKLGFYRALADDGPATADELARRTGTDARYTREWLRAQGAGQYLDYDPDSQRFSLSPVHAAVLADETSPVFLPGFFQLVEGTTRDAPTIVEAARTGAGFGWGSHNSDVHVGCERFFLPGYRANLVAGWLPALTGVVDKLNRGAVVADVGCGHGASTILMAQAFPASRFVGVDAHAASIETARVRAAEAGVADRIEFEAADARSFSGRGYDLVTTFDSLHDMGDPVGAARHVREALVPDGTWMIVEPMAADRVEDNFTPVGRAYYAFSTLLCTTGSLSQDVGLAIGTQAGPARLREVIVDGGGFSSLQQAAATPFNLVLEARP